MSLFLTRNHLDPRAVQTSGSDFTKSWQNSGLGRFGLVVLGLAFLAAATVMLQGVLTRKFHRELRLKVSARAKQQRQAACCRGAQK